MKFKVNYYDIDSDKAVEKDCCNIDYNPVDRTFSFTPVDDPPRIYKSVDIDNPIVSIYKNELGIRIVVNGYQRIKDGGYWRTTTTIRSVDEEN